MNNYKMTIQYDGGRYKGWQRLGNDEGTIQGKLENILKEQFGREIEITGCSRTDAGVHALAQIANFKIEENLTPEEVKNIFNKYLPEDICVTKVMKVDERFHARYNAKEKTYVYKIWNKEYPDPFLRKYSMHVESPLDLQKMREAAESFIGKHDFTAFSTATSKKKSMEREVYEIKIEKENGLIQIRVRGNSFLYNMVRRMVGVLVDVGTGRRKPESVAEIIESKERLQAGSIALAKGLFLEDVKY
ncbi:tRNA pseudouridine(38-40) synthase TruA [Parasporobacterium paucivorans]|uniref:tRNA pseudouridine synthase A n=1 Tax=Parasporobacterium paucivorans DSM 15970 TaxID=1122934 RepID=A0A1M6JLB4_9FIRM|nr:tRNA pseudouridine(38-40) synthase TruA [Parasporobacterium paucivorans]SHJ47432.1 tRNA pseudouridine38-40 synthase [Parasporobacterium paucivorans DSM 15970]